MVVQAKTAQTDGYEAVQLGFVEETPAKANKPTKGQFKKANVPATRVQREVGWPGRRDAEGGRPGAGVDFALGERVDIVGTGRGKGFQGVVKRHHFAGGAATDGSMFDRAPGSIGVSSFPSRVVKGMRAAGRMGGGRVTIHNLKVLRVDPDNHLLIVEAERPGRHRLPDCPQGGHAEEAQGRAGREAQKRKEIVGKWVSWNG